MNHKSVNKFFYYIVEFSEQVSWNRLQKTKIPNCFEYIGF